MSTFHLCIKTPLKNVFDKEVEELQVDTHTGRMSVLANHADLVGNVSFSKITVIEKDLTEMFFVKNATLEVSNKDNSTRLLCLECEKSSEVSTSTIKEYLKTIEDRLNNKQSLSDLQIQFLENEKIALEKQYKSL